ncbi:MAG: hypothetical protein D6766_07750 [Verrucomicrobia bacterium]|nr:MAG: hypothetical protein D6766_07750 [Verrucomicrobiota bacterium]
MAKPQHSKRVPGRPLTEAVGLSPEMLRRLGSRWFTTVEQVLGAAATPEGRDGLCRILQLEPGELEALLNRLRDQLRPETAAALKKTAQGGAMGLLTKPEAGGAPAGKSPSPDDVEPQGEDGEPHR